MLSEAAKEAGIWLIGGSSYYAHVILQALNSAIAQVLFQSEKHWQETSITRLPCTPQGVSVQEDVHISS